MPLLPRQWHKEVMYFLEDEFQTKAVVDGHLLLCSSEQISREYDCDEFNPLDGELVRICDQLAAYIEASMSIIYGIKAPDLIKGKNQIYGRNADTQICGVSFKGYFDYHYGAFD